LETIGLLKTSSLKQSLTLLLVAAFVPLLAFNQENCDEDVSPKAIKFFEKGVGLQRSSDKNEFFQKALDLEEDYVAANYEMALLSLKSASARKAGFDRVANYFKKVVELCPNYHVDPYYYLGEIHLGKREFKIAQVYYQAFLDFSSDDEKAYPEDFDEKLERIHDNKEYVDFYVDQYENPVPFDPHIVNRVSTEANEYLPLLSPDNTFMLYTRQTVDKSLAKDRMFQSDKVSYIERFVKSNRISNGYDGGTPLPEPFNESDAVNYGGATVSLDNRNMIFTRCDNKFDGTSQMMRKYCDLYYTHYAFGLNPYNGREEWHWTEPENLGPNVNTEDGWESQPSLSADGKTLFFATARADSEGIDIFVTHKQKDGKWGKAESISESINTGLNDKSPFMHSDSRTLYFSSQGHLGHGGYDIFYTKHDDKWNWSEPVNIGFPINTDEDEHGFIVSTDGKTVYYASGKFEGNKTALNILSFDLYEEARPDKVVLVTGTLENKDHKPIRDAMVELKSTKSQHVNQFEVDSTDGHYAAIITVDDDEEEVVMNVKGKDVGFQSKLLKVKDESVQEMNMETEELKVGSSYKINDIFYETSSAEISTSSKKILDEFALYLIEQENMKIAIHGHTDDIGKLQSNMSLSADRAYSVMAYLQSKGVPAERLSFKGYGPTKPLTSNSSEEGRAMNRRTEFKIISF
jgi:outer membrane protein OmpA-like peptidoglycan-associated protein/tetratricopeptide (TPR) repeat protein